MRHRGTALWGLPGRVATVGAVVAMLSLPAVVQALLCPGDCNSDGAVGVGELISTVGAALEDETVTACPALGTAPATIETVLAAIDSALHGCPAAAPPLLSSQPIAGALDIPRTAWVRLSFSAPVDPGAVRTFDLQCDGVGHAVTVSAIAADVLVANPAGDLPAGANCALDWTGPDRRETLGFTTAPAGPPATVFYDRTDARRTNPFPDDVWLAADASQPNGVRLAVPIPAAPSDVQGIFKALLPQANRLDGFSPIAHFVVELSDEPDLSSLPQTAADSLDPLATVGLFDLSRGSQTFGTRIPFELQLRTDTNTLGVMSHSLLIFPSIPLTPGGRYGFVVTRRALVDAARPLDPSAFFRSAMDPPAPGEPGAVTQVRALAGEVLDVIARGTPPIPRDDVALALRISVRTTDDIADDLLAIREQIVAADPPHMTITSVQPDSDAQSAVAAIVRGTWQAPDFRDGLYLKRDAQGRPVQAKTNTVPFILALPKMARDGAVPITMYQHGNPGSAQAEVPSAAHRSLAAAGFAVIGFTDNLNREVSAGATDETDAITKQVSAVFFALVQNRKIPDYWVETNAEQIAFVRAIQALGTLDVLPIGAPDGVPELRVSAPLTYLGISEGANHGPGLLPYAPEIRAAALVAGGERLVEVLIHQQAQAFLTTLGPVFPNLTPADIWTALALFQTIFDRQDPHNHARFIYRDPIAIGGNTEKASVLLLEGLNDTMVPNNATESLAWAMGPIPHLKPVQRAVPFLVTVFGPLVGNIDARTTAAFYQYVPVGVPGIDPTPGCAAVGQSEGHYCAQVAAESLHQRTVFFQTALTDNAPTIIDPLAQP